jgi:hypothetical protein
MRPDCSLRLRPEGLAGEVGDDDLSVWLHFDAKYRVEYADEQFAPPDAEDEAAAAEAEATERLARSKREDLLKMHAYRDAIRRSAGAYVLYPGDTTRALFAEQHEILPGLGAFALRPGDSHALGAHALEEFLADVIDHVADRATQDERKRYWGAVIHRAKPVPRPADRRLPALSVPPSDAPVLCGYLRDPAHRHWVDDAGLYNVRADNRPGAVTPDAEVLRAPDVVLYGRDVRPSLWLRTGPWFVQSADELLALGYPNPRGRVYLCCPLERRVDEPEWLAELRLGEGPFAGPARGAPFSTTWQALLEASS